MAEKKAPAKKPRFIKPPNILRQKVGTGGIDEKLLAKSQEYIDNTEIDFIPLAEEFLKEFSHQVKEARKSNDNFRKNREKIILPIMHLKANGGMLQYHLVSEVADIALQFLESVEPQDVNSDTFDVLSAHENTIRVIIGSKLRGNGGREGFALVKELDKACKRYFTKYAKTGA